MLNPRFKGFCLVSSHVGHEQGMFIVEEYDAKTLYPMLLKCYHYLHLVGENEFSDVANHEDEDCKLDIIQTIASSNEPMKNLMTKKFLNFKRFHVDVKDIKSLLLW
jgi:hypothetical protein